MFLSLNLRAEGVHPRAVDPEVRVFVDSQPIAGNWHESQDVFRYGDGDVHWYVSVPSWAELCCYLCREGLVEARLVDSSGQTCVSRVTVLVSDGGCPDPRACCEVAEMCPDGIEVRLCESPPGP